VLLKNKTETQLQFIGTSSGITSKDRFHSSFIISSRDRVILIDAGDSVCKAILNAGYEFTDITDIILTHFHADHVSGIAPLLTQMKIAGREISLKIYTPEILENNLQFYLEMTYLFEENFGYPFEIIPITDKEYNKIGTNFNFSIIQNSHVSPKNLARAKNEIPFYSGSLYFTVGNAEIFYTSDIGSNNDLKLYGAKKPGIFISECAHVELQDVLDEWIISGAEKLFLTHYDEDTLPIIEHFIDTAGKKYHGKIIMAVDQLIIPL